MLAVTLAPAAAAQQGLTIYSDGRVLMRSVIQSAVPAGNSTHRVPAGFLDPGSIFSLDSTVTITGASYDASVDEANTLRRAIGRKLVFDTGIWKDSVMQTVEAEVLGVEPELYRMPDGTLSFQRPGRPRYPADLVLVAPTLNLNVRSTAARESLRLGWFSDGAAWAANYAVALGRGTARVSGQAEIQSGRLSVNEAQIQLLSGNVGRAPGASPASPREYAMVARSTMKAADQAASEEGVGEVHLYSIPGNLTLRPGTSTLAALFDPATTTWERSFILRGQLPWYGPLPQYGEEDKPPVEVEYVLKRALKTTFGDAPLPAGFTNQLEPSPGVGIVEAPRSRGQRVRPDRGADPDRLHHHAREQPHDRECRLSGDDQQRQGFRRDRRGRGESTGRVVAGGELDSRQESVVDRDPLQRSRPGEGPGHAHLSCAGRVVTDGPIDRPADSA